MKGRGTVAAVHTAPEKEAPMESHDEIEAVAGRGLRGDRYFAEAGTFSHLDATGQDVTLTEAEAIEAIEREAGIDLSFADHRRNVTTRDAALNHLVGERFRIGEVVCEGMRLCEPCDHLESLLGDGVSAALKHRGGLRADVVEGGTIRVGDELEVL